MNFDPVIFAAVTFFSTMLGGLFATRFRNKFDIRVMDVMYGVAVGFLLLHVPERCISVHLACTDDECKNVRHPKGDIYGAGELFAHSFLDGFAIGIGFQTNPHVCLIVAVAVISHGFSDGLNTVTVMLNSGNTLRSSLQMLIMDAATPILGAASTLFFVLPIQYPVSILPFFAGVFLCLGVGDLLRAAHERNPPLVSVILASAGFVVIFVITGFLDV